jgi:fumarate hydratase class I
MEELIYERTGAKPGTSGGLFSLNPRVDDIPDRFSVAHQGIRFLRLGTIESGGSTSINTPSPPLATTRGASTWWMPTTPRRSTSPTRRSSSPGINWGDMTVAGPLTQSVGRVWRATETGGFVVDGRWLVGPEQLVYDVDPDMVTLWIHYEPAGLPGGHLMQDLIDHFTELIRQASTDLPADIEAALREAQAREEPGSPAARALEAILKNTALARANSTPICQDTCVPTFYVHYPQGVSTRQLQAQIEAAVVKATERTYLRPNAVDALSGRNSGNNLGIGLPVLHFEEWEEDVLKIDLLLKGGGSENVGAQYRLPSALLEAGRDLEGVRRVVLDAVHQVQGRGCAPGMLGIALGSDRGTGYIHAKRQLLRPLDDSSPVPELTTLEKRLLCECNELGIGPMGLGGRTTVLGVKIEAYHRHPACYFVSIAYMCWACRRARMIVQDGEVMFE